MTRSDGVRLLRTLDVPGISLSEAIYDAAASVQTQPRAWATLCLAVEGGYQVEWSRTRLRCGPTSLMFQPPGQVYGARISDVGSHCLTVGIDPGVLMSASDRPLDFEQLSAARRTSPHWLAFELRSELGLGDDLSVTAVASTVVELLAELGDRPALHMHSTPPPWLERVLEQIDDEFRRHHTLANLAGEAGVHHVHLAREFRRRFGCTVGHYIRQRRVEFACHRLAASRDALSEIALEAGFADQSHFTNAFRRLVGMTPAAFRARFVHIHSHHLLRS